MKNIIAISVLLCLCAFLKVHSQAIVLDKLVKAGDLTVFPSIYDENEYYYLSDQVRLAKDENGKPEFSFLRWVENESTDDNEDSYKDTEGAGGGIVTALVELRVTEEQRQNAEQELRRVNPRGKIKGPVMYRGGTVALVSAFNAENEEFSQQVLGLGPAPVLDGQKASVSIQLTKKGSKILWESFKTNTPNVVFKFNMEIEGYNSPISAKINFQWEKIYEHQNFQAGVATPVLAAEVDVAVSEMINNNTIKITEIGEDEDFDEIRTTVMEIIRTEMFESQENSSTPSLSSLSTGHNSRPSMLDRATSLLNTQRQDYQRERSRSDAEEARRRRDAERERSRTANTESNTSENTNSESEASSDSEEEESDAENNDIEPRAGEAVRRANPQDEPSTVPPYEVTESGNEAEPQAPTIAIAASYSFKKIKKSGTFNLSLEKSLLRNQVINFDEGIGSIKCNDCFRMINLDDPLYKQREILAFIDGSNTTDFGEYINFVSVLLKKKHENGDITQREIRIDRKNFDNGNNFKFDPYGWKGDKNRSKWLEYDFKATWSFFGGHEVSTPWTKREAGSISLSPPFQKKDIYIETDDSVVDENDVRFAEVKIYYNQGEKEKIERVRIDFSKEDISKRVSIVQLGDELDYKYEVKWFMKGKEPLLEEKKSASDETIYLSNVGQF
ncbi:hypothetical protein [Muriicola sp. Z0-33]|uniref:hypothetical protein n=1 Tax=Muriicola sp. Z0-33 TaxID=2816957 RepID=UPI0022378ADB|nr:hypothetical protein [Muriicola sp. Z0-33]MCW5516883.1 hypothetical protein [Muriicola sp. Z0-33]